MRLARFAPLLLALACATPPPPVAAPPVASTPPALPAVYGFTPEEEARVLRLEDRREFDQATVEQWLANPNSLHRARMALALGRIGSQTFLDRNNNGEKDPGEPQAGVTQLTALVADPDRTVRETAGFALGEIGDPSAADALVQLASDADGGVAAEAVEALSKLAPALPLARYAPFAAATEPDGIRVRAIRFLFRFASDDAGAIAAAALEAPSPAVREAAAYALARRAYAPAREKLVLLLTDPNMQTRMYAATALGRIGTKESFAPLFESLRDAYPWVRTNALVALGRIVAKDPTAIRSRTDILKDALQLEALAQDPDPGTRAAAIDTLALYAAITDVARKRLFDLAANGSRWDRELAGGALARQFGDTNPAATDELLTTAGPWAKVRVAEASGGLHATGASLRKRLAADRDAMVRANAVAAVPDDAVDAELDVIRPLLDDPDVIVRTNTIDRYAKSKTRDVALLEAAEAKGRADAQDDARLSAIAALADIDRPEREPFLRALLADRDPVVRRVAADLIEEKLKKPRPQFTPLPIERTSEEYAQIVAWSHQPHSATIHMTRGNIEISLATQDAPATTWNFAQLARKHYFDNSSFMRVVPNFVIQGGDPRNDMSGGPGYAIRDEMNMQKYTRGAVGMALSGPDTGGSQFFITHSPQPHLDGGYTVFGHVYEGMGAVVDQTERGDKVDSITIDERKP
jgi:cyclophilin family peptidyl-prolyl cis-trans isomerase/HEAT repeat protein